MNKDYQLEHLIRMANQIADNLPARHGDEADAAEHVADHIRHFWARSMRDQLAAYAQAKGSELNAIALAAILRLDSTQTDLSHFHSADAGFSEKISDE